MFKKKEKESYFYGKHFDGVGGMLAGLYGNADEFLDKYLRRSCAEGIPFFSKKLNRKTIHTLIYPAIQDITILNYVKEIRKKQNEHVTICPILRGVENKVILKEAYTWGNGVEGEVAVRTLSENELILNFYDPFFPIDKDYFVKNEECIINLSAIVRIAEELEESEDVFTEGPLYESYLQKFLEENPDKTKADFEPVVIHTCAEHMRMCINTNTTSVYEIIGLIEDIKYTEFLGKKVAILKVNLEHREDEEYFYVNVYVSEHLLENYTPKIGQGFHGIVHLTGFFKPNEACRINHPSIPEQLVLPIVIAFIVTLILTLVAGV